MMKFINYYIAHQIYLIVLPPHSTQTLQPLDIVIFKPLASAYNEQLNHFIFECAGLLNLRKGDFFRLFYAAWEASFTKKNIEKAFKAARIYPFDLLVVLSKFMPTQPTTYEDSKAYSLASWRSILVIIQAIEVNPSPKNTREVTETIHEIFVRKEITTY